MNTKQLQSYHLEVARQSNKCADILRLISRVNLEVDSIVLWLGIPELDWKFPNDVIQKQIDRRFCLITLVLPRLMSYYQSQLIKLEQIYRA